MIDVVYFPFRKSRRYVHRAVRPIGLFASLAPLRFMLSIALVRGADDIALHPYAGYVAMFGIHLRGFDAHPANDHMLGNGFQYVLAGSDQQRRIV